MFRFILLSVLVLVLSGKLTAQSGQQQTEPDSPLRLEIKVDSDNETYRIIPCGKAGMILFYRSIELTENNEARWYFSFYDTNLNHLWIKSVPVVSSLQYREAQLFSDTLCCFFDTEKKTKQAGITFQILRIDLHSGKMVLNNGKLTESTVTSGFRIYRQLAFIPVIQDQRKALLLTMHLPTGQVKTTTLFEGVEPSIMAVTVDTVQALVSTLISHETSKTSHEVVRIRTDFSGNKTAETTVGGFGSDYILTSLQEILLPENKSLLAGTYSQATGSRKDPQSHVTGWFTAFIEQEIVRDHQFLNFLDLQNIRNLLGAKDILDLRKKSMKKRSTDLTYSLDFSLVVHPVQSRDNQYILAAETYYPQFHTEAFTDYDFYGRPYTNSYSVFDGYRFTGIILTSVDARGKLLWDNAISFRNVLAFTLNPNVCLWFNNNETILAYLSEGRIGSAILNGKDVVERTSWSDPDLLNPGDKLLAETKSIISHWYDNCFLSYGYQEIRDITKGTNDKRLVYYCSKLMFER